VLWDRMITYRPRAERLGELGQLFSRFLARKEKFLPKSSAFDIKKLFRSRKSCVLDPKAHEAFARPPGPFLFAERGLA
jgi:hypothetical protein